MMNVQPKKIIITQIILIAFIGITLITAVFAWFATGIRSQTIIIKTGNLEVEAVLYQANDPDFDGIFDESDYVAKTSDILIEHAMSNQIYSFKLVIKNKSSIAGNLTVTLKDILFLDDTNNPSPTFNEAFELKYSNINGDTYDHHQTTFPQSDFVIGTMANFDYASGNNEVVIKFQIIVNKHLTSAHYGYTFQISTILVKLEQNHT